MIKNVIIFILLLVTAWLAYSVYGDTIDEYFAKKEPAPKAETVTSDSELCAQVITSARNPETGDIQEFPTPCDVPKKWEVIQNDIPGMGDLQ